jgi:hypothetical protein
MNNHQQFCRSLITIARCATLTLALATTVSAQPAANPPCRTPEYRQFDFWLGEWEVFEYQTGQKGNPAGASRVTSLFDGCSIQEEYLGAGNAVVGKSLNVYFPQDKRWHQLYVDGFAQVILLHGTFKDNQMVLSGEYPSLRTPGLMIKQSITWTKLSANEVQQRWVLSSDGGQNWQELFNGLYVRKVAKP